MEDRPILSAAVV